MSTATAAFERGRLAIICRWFGHNWRHCRANGLAGSRCMRCGVKR